MPFTRRGLSDVPCSAPPRKSNIPVRTGPNSRYHKPVMSYDRPIPQAPKRPYRYMMVPGLPRGLRPGVYIDPNEKDPFGHMYNAKDLMEVEQKEEEMRRERLRNPRPRLVPGERATGFTDLCGTDPNNPYGLESWASSAWDEDASPSPKEDLGDPFLRPLQIERDRFYNETANNTHWDLLRRDWDLEEKCRRESHLHRDRHLF